MQKEHTTSQTRDDRTKSILSDMKNNTNAKSVTNARQKVIDLLPNEVIQRLELVVLRRYPRRLVNSANCTGSLAAACGRDETGLVGIVLWGEQVNRVKSGDVIRIENGWCRSRDGEIIVSTGRNGSLIILDK